MLGSKAPHCALCFARIYSGKAIRKGTELTMTHDEMLGVYRVNRELMNKKMPGLLPLSVVAGLILSGCVTSHRTVVTTTIQTVTTTHQLTATGRPPPPQAEVITSAPTETPAWVHAYWILTSAGRWVWLPGHWEERPAAGAVWVPGSWENPDGRGWVWRRGHWE